MCGPSGVGPDEQAGGLVMKKSVFARAVLAGVLLLSLPTAAHAATGDDYTPGVGGSVTLAGSDVSSVCENDVPWISYSVTLTDPDNQVTERDAHLVLSDASHSTTIDLGDLGADGKLSGRVLWPGASVAGDGSANGWPGFGKVDGTWVQTSDNFAWTRGDISAKVVVNPEVEVALSYPAGNCGPAVTGAPAGVSAESTLAVTGSNAATLPFLLGGGAVLLVGAGLFVYSRRRAH